MDVAFLEPVFALQYVNGFVNDTEGEGVGTILRGCELQFSLVLMN